MALKVGIQLYSIGALMDSDPEKALISIMEAGYRNFEVANPCTDKDPITGYGVPLERIMELMKPYDAKIVSGHLWPLTDDVLPSIVKTHKALGSRNVAQGIAFFTSYDHLMKCCEEYNHIGKYLVENDMNPFIYHNHYHEYQMLNGKPIMHHILENTDPQYVKFEVDAGWVKRAGRNPVDEIRYIGNRVHLLHIKDFAKTPPNLLIGKDELIGWDTFAANHQPGDVMTPKDFSEIGTGIMDIQSVIDIGNELGVEYMFLEQDDSDKDIIESVKLSMDGFKSLKNISL